MNGRRFLVGIRDRQTDSWYTPMAAALYYSAIRLTRCVVHRHRLMICLIVALVGIESVLFASDTIAPAIISVTASPGIAAAGDMIRVTVLATDDVSVSSVTADSLPLQQTAGAWQGWVPAKSQTGPHTVDVVAADAAGNTATDASSGYVTQSVVGISNAGASSSAASAAASSMLFRVWGRAAFVDADHFDLDDGSGHPLRISSPGHIVRTGDYVTARGQLQSTESGVLLNASYYDIPAFAPGNTITAPDKLLGNHLQYPWGATLGQPAPAGSPVTVTLTSLDPGRLLLGTTASPMPSSLVTVSTTQYISYTLLGLADCGVARIAAVSSDGQRGLFKVRLAPTGWIISGDSVVDRNRYESVFMHPLGVQCVLLDPSTHAVVDSGSFDGCLGYGLPDVSVAFANSNPAVAAPSANPMVLQGYVSPNTVKYYETTLQLLDFGTTVLSLITPPGFTTPSERQTLTANVVQPRMGAYGNAYVGRNLQMSQLVSFQTGPSTYPDVTLTVDDGSIATLTAAPALEGSGSITLHGARSGGTSYYMQGRSVGQTTLTFSSPGYTSASETVFVSPSGFVLTSPSIITNKYAANTSISMKSARLGSTLAFAEYQNLRGGLSVSIPVSSSDPGVGVVTVSPAVMTANSSYVNTAFDPIEVGSCIISIGTPDGFQTPTTSQQTTATVNAPKITISSGSVGRNLQASKSFTLEAAPPTPIDVTISIDDTSIALVSSSSTAVGAASTVFSGVSTTSKTFYVQGVNPGQTSIRVSAPGYTDAVANLSVFTCGFELTPSVINTITMSPDYPFGVTTVFQEPGTRATHGQSLRPGADPVSLTMQCSDASVGSITVNPLVCAVGSGTASSAFHPLSEGTCTLSLTQPDGYEVPPVGGYVVSIPVTVRKPNIAQASWYFNNAVGVDLQTKYTCNLEMAPPSPVDVTVSVADSSVATVSRVNNLAGTGTCVVTGVNSTSEFYYYLQGRSEGTTILTLSAPGYADKVATVSVVRPALAFSEAVPTTVTLSHGARVIEVYCGIPVTGWLDELPLRGGMGNLSVPIYSSNPAVGTIVGSPVSFRYDTSETSVSFMPVAPGTCYILMTVPTGWSTVTGYDRVTVTVTP